MRSSVAAVLLLAHEAQSHAMLTVPTGRPHVIDPNGPKLTPFSDARYVANRGCGGVDNGGETVIMPSLNPATNVFIAGSTIEIKWKLTIPHNADNRDTGIRVSLHYEENDSFECNILGGGLDGDPGFHPVQEGAANPRVLSAGPDDAVTNQEVSTLVTLPDKTCDYCVLQWAWAARSDGGFYISCADIAITTDGRPASPRRPADALAFLLSTLTPTGSFHTNFLTWCEHMRLQATCPTTPHCRARRATSCRSTNHPVIRQPSARRPSRRRVAP